MQVAGAVEAAPPVARGPLGVDRRRHGVRGRAERQQQQHQRFAVAQPVVRHEAAARAASRGRAVCCRPASSPTRRARTAQPTARGSRARRRRRRRSRHRRRAHLQSGGRCRCSTARSSAPAGRWPCRGSGSRSRGGRWHRRGRSGRWRAGSATTAACALPPRPGPASLARSRSPRPRARSLWRQCWPALPALGLVADEAGAGVGLRLEVGKGRALQAKGERSRAIDLGAGRAGSDGHRHIVSGPADGRESPVRATLPVSGRSRGHASETIDDHESGRPGFHHRPHGRARPCRLALAGGRAGRGAQRSLARPGPAAARGRPRAGRRQRRRSRCCPSRRPGTGAGRPPEARRRQSRDGRPRLRADRRHGRPHRRHHRPGRAAERYPRRPHAGADRRLRHDLREPAQRDHRGRGPGHQERQRLHPARRLGSSSLQSGVGRHRAGGARRGRPAARSGAARGHSRSCRRRPAPRRGRCGRPHHSARRPRPHRAGRPRGQGAGAQAPRRQLPRLRRRRRTIWRWPSASSTTPRRRS